MSIKCKDLSLNDVMTARATFADDMPIWKGKFGDDIWPFLTQEDPLSRGNCGNALVWRDYVHGRGATFGHQSSRHNSRYIYRLTSDMADDLKIAAAIYANFPAILKHARLSKGRLDPKTVKARIDDLAKIFSAAIVLAEAKYGVSILRLRDVSFGLLKEAIAQHAGRGAHLKRALKLISDPIVQKNLSAPLQWQLIDIEKGSINWPKTEDGPGIPTLDDVHFLFILDHCLQSIVQFKKLLGLPLHSDEIRKSEKETGFACTESVRKAVHQFLSAGSQSENDVNGLDIGYKQLESFIANAQCASIMLILLLTGMRSSETKFILCDSMVLEHGYWFIRSKVLKNRPKDLPISEGWLAIDSVRDAYDVLSFLCSFTGNKYLFSSPFIRFSTKSRGYAFSLNTKLSRWLRTFDVDALYADWTFSVHQCRETLVSQLAKQQVGLPFISMQLKHFQSRFFGMPNEVTVGYGKYRAQLMTSVASRMATATESALADLYSEGAKFAGGGAEAHKARIDTFFAGLGLFGVERVRYIRSLANRGVKVQPTSIGGCTRNFELPVEDTAPPCYGDFECDPDCKSHVITQRGAQALSAMRDHALAQAQREPNSEFKVIWVGLANKLDLHVKKLAGGGQHAN